jgi:aspartyl/glutamyl-tRNA(Asn/Gln) amidotransferase C subunit
MADSFPPTQLEALCRLARLQLTRAQAVELAARLEAVIAAFATLAAVDTSKIAADPPAGSARLRPDEPGPPLPRELVLGNAATTAADCFLVPRVVEG